LGTASWGRPQRRLRVACAASAALTSAASALARSSTAGRSSARAFFTDCETCLLLGPQPVGAGDGGAARLVGGEQRVDQGRVVTAGALGGADPLGVVAQLLEVDHGARLPSSPAGVRGPAPNQAGPTPTPAGAPVTRRLPALSLALLALTVPVAASAVAADGPVVGVPPLQDAAQGWVEGWTDPDHWTGYATDAVVDGHVNVPYPNDPVKPEAYLPNVPVAQGDRASALPVVPRDLSGVTYTHGGQTKTIAQFVRTTRTDQVVLVKDGVVVGEWYANGFSADVRHQAWSVTKTFVAAVVGIAHGEGLHRLAAGPDRGLRPRPGRHALGGASRSRTCCRWSPASTGTRTRPCWP
jgi:hypothetical protein